ncbi:MAG: hypothetical protein JWN41_434, partial [Thermoleophilia bacterium]|nr:hypothetical protein [Thermoleophilia bacterium]
QIDATAGHPDGVSAHDALRLITWATVGYLVSRGLAKSGSRDAYWDDQSTRGPGDSANVR